MKSNRGNTSKGAGKKKSVRGGAKRPGGNAPAKRRKRAAAPMKMVAAKKPAAAKQVKAPVRSAIVDIALRAMDDMKAVHVVTLDVRGVTDIADNMIIASGNSDRHVRAIAARVVEFAKKAGYRPMGVEGERDGEWVLVDLQDVIVHVMLPRVREFYRLESLWDVTAARREAAQSQAK
jgi:ribosome-associated protein